MADSAPRHVTQSSRSARARAEKVSGETRYAFDMAVARMLHAKLLRSPHAHARIRRIDTSAAAAMPGVVCIVTGADLHDVPDPTYGVGLRDQLLVATDRVRYRGDTVAGVVARDEATAWRAAEAIVVEYDPMPAVISVEEALAPEAPELFDNPPAGNGLMLGLGALGRVAPARNVLYEYTFGYGDVDAWLMRAARIHEDRFDITRINHFHLEPFVNIAHWERDRLELWSCNQDPFVLRADLARIFALPVNRVRVHSPPIGGGFGGKSYCKMEPLVALMARKAGAPVRLALTMDEAFLTLVKHPASIELTTGVDDRGGLLARRARILLDGGAYADASVLVAIKSGFRIGGPYKWQAIDASAKVVRTNTVPSGSFRGFGGTQSSWACERQMDMIAKRMGMDPVAFRRLNLLKRGDDFAPGDLPMDCDIEEGLDEVVERIESRPRAEGRGRGYAIGIKDAGGTGNHAQAFVRVSQSGEVMVSTAAMDVGQGAPAALCRIATDELGLPPESATYADIDTEHTPADNGTHVSCATMVTGSAVRAAARDARAQILRFAAERLGCAASDLSLDQWSVRRGNESHPLEPMIRSYYGGIGWEFNGRGAFKEAYDPAAPMGARNISWMLCWSGAEVSVDRETGLVRVERLIVGAEPGRVLDRVACHGQVEGAAAQAFAQAMFEQLRYHAGTLDNASPLQYRVPRAHDMPAQFESFLLEHGGGPDGVKGIGEAGMLGIAAAIANAIEDACGASLTSMPFTPERVLAALDAQATP